MDGEEESDWGALAAEVEAFELDNPEEAAELAEEMVASKTRNCRRRRDDANDQQRQGGDEQVISPSFHISCPLLFVIRD